MSAECSGVVLVGSDRRDQWGGVEHRPAWAVYLIHFGAPVVALEVATASDAWAFPNSMVVRPEPADFAYDLAYFILQRDSNDLESGAAALPELEGWPIDPRDTEDGFEVRSRLHRAITEAVRTRPTIRLEVVALDGDPMLGADTVATLRKIGFKVDTYGPVGEPADE